MYNMLCSLLCPLASFPSPSSGPCNGLRVGRPRLVRRRMQQQAEHQEEGEDDEGEEDEEEDEGEGEEDDEEDKEQGRDDSDEEGGAAARGAERAVDDVPAR